MINHGVRFVLAHCSWARGLPWRVDIPSDTLLEKTDFPLFQQTLIWVGLCVHFPLSVLGFYE